MCSPYTILGPSIDGLGEQRVSPLLPKETFLKKIERISLASVSKIWLLKMGCGDFSADKNKIPSVTLCGMPL